MDYERIKPIANDLLRRGYAIERIAALMFRYGWTSGRKALKESQAFRRQAYVAQGCQEPSQSFFGALQCAAQAAEQHIFIFCAFC